MEGIINFFKPKGMTSHDAVYYFRRLYKTKKIGHTGTLDPMATGVLPICVGRATRVSEYLLDVGKEYFGELTLGSQTDTQDKEGKIINFSNKKVDIETINMIFQEFKGEQEQIPPMYSAKKVDGKKLYELAREGIVIDRKPSIVNISEIKLIHNIDNRKIIFYVKCSKGTYIRTLCNDIGNRLGTFGHMSFLLRAGVGDFKLSNSYGIDTLNKMNESQREDALLPMDYAVTHLKKIHMNQSKYKHLTNGLKIKINTSNEIKDNESIRVYCAEQFIGIGKLITENDERMIKMDKVLIG